MSQTYSTRQKEFSGGKLFSSRYTTVAVSPAPPPQPEAPRAVPTRAVAQEAEPPAPVPQRPVPEPVEQSHTFALSGAGLPQAKRIAPAGYGTVVVKGRPGQPFAVTGTISGLTSLKDPALQPTLWLIHDLAVPRDLAPEDLARLPKGAYATANLPGTPFTVDGNLPTYGANSNTLSIVICPGVFQPGSGGLWQVNGSIDAGTNQAFHPLVVLGPSALADINVSLPTGTVARILTDLFMRPTTVHPELSLSTQFPARLTAVVNDVLGSGTVPTYVSGEQFTRAAVTLEGLVRGTPRLMPTRDTSFLQATARQAS